MIISTKDDFKLSIEQVGNAASAFTYPIFQMNEHNRPELVASCVAVEINGKYFLCTAKHTIESLDKSRTTFCANSNLSHKGLFIELNGEFVYTEDTEDIDFDLCLINVCEIKDKFQFLNERRIALGSDFSPKSFNVMVGYPLSKNKPTKSINPDNNEVTTGFLPVGVKLDSNIDFSTFQGIKETVHIGFRYKLSHKRQSLTCPRGMSGCGVWNVPSVYNTSSFSLAGIFIEYHRKEKVGFATKGYYIKELSDNLV